MTTCQRTRSRERRAKIYKSLVVRKDNLNPWQWMEKHVVLTKSDKRGAYRTSFNPIWRWIFEQVDNPDVKQISIMGGVQFGKSQFMNNVAMWHIVNGKGEIMYVGQSEKDVLKWKRTKYDPDEAACEIVQKLKPKKKQGSYIVEYDTCNLILAWGSSESSTASSTISLLLADEIDKYKHLNKRDIHPIHAVLKRLKAVENPLAILTSTPTVEDGAINQQYKLGSQHRPQCKCMKCGTWQELDDLSRLITPPEAQDEKGRYNMDAVRDFSYIECANKKCLHKITEEERRFMIGDPDHVKFVSHNEQASREHVSVNVSRFYTFLNTTIGDIAVEYLEKKDKPQGLKDFYTQVMALPYQHKAVTNTESEIMKLQERTPFKYQRTPRAKGEVHHLPFVPIRITTTVDVQGDCFWIMQSAFAQNGHVAILDWGRVFSFKELEQWRLRKYSYEHRGEKRIMISSLNYIDSGYKAKAQGGVYQFVVATKGQWLPCVGRKNDLFEKIQKTAIEYRGAGFELTSFQDDFFKELAYFHRIKGLSKEQVWLPEIIDNELIDQLINEQKVQTFDTLGEEIYKWKCVTSPANNHLGDCFKMMLVLFEEFADKYIR